MGVVYVLIGGIVFALVGLVFVGISFLSEAITHSMSKTAYEHIGLIPVGLVAAYLIGYAVKENYMTGKKS